MRSSFGKLRKFALQRGEGKEQRAFQASRVNELAQAAQEMQNMRNCYDSLLSAAAATANSAYEFSESLREMGACLQEKTASNNDDKDGKVLTMLGKVQFELQKLVDSYRSHIFLTITTPSESLLNELRTVEEMKRQCDEKRNLYEYMLAQQKEKGRSKTGKGESFTMQQLQQVHDDYDEEATLCVFRLKSLKQGQSRSLLTQAVRHYAAQLNFFRKGLKSLEAVEPHVRRVTEQQHIDFQFRGLEDDGESGSVNNFDTNEDSELSFDYRINKQGLDVTSTSRNSMELEQPDVSFHQASTTEDAEVNFDKIHGEQKVFSQEPKAGSHSAPIFAEKIDQSERLRQPLYPRKFHAYALPMPVDPKSSTPSSTSSSVPSRQTSHSGHGQNLWHSTPLAPNRHDKDSGDDNFSGPATLKGQLSKDANPKSTSVQLPPPLAEALQLPQVDTQNVSGSKKIKRNAFSGPLASKPLPAKPILSSSGPIASTELPQSVSGLLSRVPVQGSSSPKVSPSASPPPLCSPRMSELHKLPRPPGTSTSKTEKSPFLAGHSAPLVNRNQEFPAANKVSALVSNSASPLPMPPPTVQRSFSIPPRGERAAALQVTRLLGSPEIPFKPEEVVSPPITPISLKNMTADTTIPEVWSRSTQIRGNWDITRVMISY